MCTCRETVFVAVDKHNVQLHPAIRGKHNGPIRPPSGVDCFREVYFAGWLSAFLHWQWHQCRDY